MFAVSSCCTLSGLCFHVTRDVTQHKTGLQGSTGAFVGVW